MGKLEAKKIVNTAKDGAKNLVRGFVRTVCGAAVAGLVSLSVYGFATLSSESGWTAVFNFIASCATMCVALSNMYLLGARKRGKKNG